MLREDIEIFENVTQLLTVQEAASFLHIHTNTLRRWSDDGILQVYRFGPRGDRRFRREDIIRFLNGSNPTESRLRIGTVRETAPFKLVIK